MFATQHCSLEAQVFEANSIPYLGVRQEGHQEATEFVMRINNRFRSVPTIVFPDGSALAEPSWEELSARFTKS